MIGQLPTTITVNGKELHIETDFRTALLVLVACNDVELSDREKVYVMVDALVGFENLEREDVEEAIKKCSWFMDGGKDYSKAINKPKLMDWEQDEQIIFSAINRVAGKEVRTESYLHWWSFLGYFNEIQEGLFSNVLNIRQKKAKHKQLEKWEQDFYKDNKDLIDFKTIYTEAEKEEIRKINERFK